LTGNGRAWGRAAVAPLGHTLGVIDRGSMERVRGIGGIFFKSKDPKSLSRWYAENLGVPPESWGGAVFKWRDHEGAGQDAYTVWSPFAADTTYFAPSDASFMINFRVDDLDRMLDQLRRNGVTVDDRREESEQGRFGWAMDPEGNRIELWEPPKPPAP